ncbi:MAG: Cell division protein FtsL [Gammaproteobacteria bacterium]|nr:Cell division protein FtsL [Gammaproteobacteria bacterium]
MRNAMVVLAVLVVLSSFTAIFVRHQHRLTFNALQFQQQQRDSLNTEWHQLLLEQSTWSFRHFVEKKARDRLDMVFPKSIHRLVVEGR